MQQVVVTFRSRTASAGHTIDGAVCAARAALPLLGERVDDALNGARRPLVQQPMRRTSTYAHDGATRVRAPGALSHPARKRVWGSNLFSVLVQARRPSRPFRLADCRGSSTVHGRRPCPRHNCPHCPALPSWLLPPTPSLLRPLSSHSPALVPGRPTVGVEGRAACQPTNGNACTLTAIRSYAHKCDETPVVVFINFFQIGERPSRGLVRAMQRPPRRPHAERGAAMVIARSASSSRS